MPKEINYKFYIRIVLPSILAITFFIVSIFALFIPSFESNMLERKKEMISELTNTAWSIFEEYQLKVDSGEMSLEEAQNQAADIVRLMRYGEERNDYFWIIDTDAKMIMHPFRPELNGTDLSNYQDTEGTYLFSDAVELVKAQGEGYIQYIWQWKNDPSRLGPKLTFVKEYTPWKWIIGTGIYLEDVKTQIAALKWQLIRLSLLIFLVIAAMLLYMVRQSLNIERKRRLAENDLIVSRQKYKSLVEASTEGTLMISEEKIIFANMKLIQMIGKSFADVQKMTFSDIFDMEWEDVLQQFSDPNKTLTLETRIKPANDKYNDVVISVSQVEHAGQYNYIVVARDVSQQKRLEKGSVELTNEMQIALSLMNQPIHSHIKEIITCNSSSTISEAASLMARKDQDVIFVKVDNHIAGMVTDHVLNTRVLASGMSPTSPVSLIMDAPVVSITDNALMYEAVLLFKNKAVSHLLVKNIGDEYVGIVSYFDLLTMQHNSLNYMINEIKIAENAETLRSINNRMPVLVNALLETGDKTGNINHIITSITDALATRIIELATDKCGPPPCDFAFISLGSEGRKEQTLSTDQDNAIVFENVSGEVFKQAYAYFRKLGKEVNTNLDHVGYRFCKGNIMAMNPKWTQPLDIWKAYFTDWINSSDPQSILDSSIFFDLRCLYGNCEFADRLTDHIHQQSDKRAVFFTHMSNPILKFKPRLNILGNIVHESEGNDGKMVDIKKIQLPIVGFARLYALKYKIRETNTLARISKLHELKHISSEFYNELVLAYNVLMQLRLRFQLQAEFNNEKPNNLADMGKLTAIEVTTLKKILSEMENLQAQVSFDFKGTI